VLGQAQESRLARLFGGHPAPELFGLWLTEVVLGTLLLYGLLSAGDGRVAGSATAAVALALGFGLTSVAVGLYSPDAYQETRQLLLSTAVGAALAFPLVWLLGRVLGVELAGLSWEGRLHAVQALLAWTLALFALRLGFAYALRAKVFARRVVLIGPEAAVARLAAMIGRRYQGFFEVAAMLPAAALAVPGDTPLPAATLGGRRVWGVIVAGEAVDAIPSRQLLRAQARGVRLYTDADFCERRLRQIAVARGPVAEPGGHWAGADWQGPVASASAAALRRGFDIALSLALLVFTLPLMLLTALAIKLDSAGPVLYRQERVGFGGRHFTLLKFRSMRPDAEQRGPVWAASGDPRVTRVGSVIRLVRIDELPQLLNILRGEMSFIGPRPERPHFVAQLERELPFYADRLLVKPGLTGWAQVNYPYGASVEDARAKLSYDLYYVKHRSLLLDLLILLGTVRVVLFQRGAR
jgi:exopolysaccharide biosynthesis polyprenyl glycosylphosphotransferase